jgi:thiosulfate reductase cytochrome b subunit
VLGIVLVLSGLAIWKPVTLGFITALFVNYKWARVVHFVAMALLLLLALVHVFMVISVDPYSLRAIVTGWYDRARSPEARNARPFYHLFGARRSEPSSEPPPS